MKRNATGRPSALTESSRLGRALSYLVIWTGTAIVLFPFFWQISTSLKAANDVFQWPPIWFPFPPHFENYAEVASIVPLGLYLRNSVTIALTTIVAPLDFH